MNIIKFDTIDNVKRYHSGYFFTPEAMRFFRSKVYETTATLGDLTYFITSEKCPTDKRRYTIRTMSRTGSIALFSAFEAYSSKKQAEKALAKHLGLNEFYA